MIKKINILAGIFILGFHFCEGQNGLKPNSIYMYKNGYAWVVSSGKVNCENGRWSLVESEVPKASLGSFWFSSSVGINFVRREIDTISKTIFQPGLEELLKLNIGKSIKINWYTSTGNQTIEGVIHKYFELPKDSTQQYVANPAIASIKTATGIVVLYHETFSKILYAEFGSDAVYNASKKTPEGRLNVYFKNKSSKNTDLKMVYLSQHPAWSPIYRLELDENNKADLTLGAEVSGGSSDFKNADLNLVVGNPVFSYGNVLSRLASVGYSNSEYYNENEDMRRGAYKSIDNSASMGDRASFDDVVVTSGKSEDFYIYNIKNFSIQKNQTAFVEILKEKTDITHKYICELPSVSMYYVPAVIGGIDDAPNMSVYHYIKFKNPAKQPLTAAPIFIEKLADAKDVAIAQPIMETVAVGGIASVQVALNLDLPVKQFEEEIKRTPDAYTYNGKNETINYDLIEIKSSVHLENQSDKEKTLNLNRSIEGKALTSEVNWTIKTLKPLAGSPNSLNYINWEIKLKPGEKKDYNYTYQYLLRVY